MLNFQKYQIIFILKLQVIYFTITILVIVIKFGKINGCVKYLGITISFLFFLNNTYSMSILSKLGLRGGRRRRRRGSRKRKSARRSRVGGTRKRRTARRGGKRKRRRTMRRRRRR